MAVDLSKSELTKSIQSVANVDNMSTIEFEKMQDGKFAM